MSGKFCRECEIGHLKIIGLGGFDDLVQVECSHCGAIYDLEPDGLGMGGEEFAIAQMIALQQGAEEK